MHENSENSKMALVHIHIYDLILFIWNQNSKDFHYDDKLT